MEGGVNGIAIIGSEVEGVGFFGFFSPKMYQAIAVKTWFSRRFGRLEPALDTR